MDKYKKIAVLDNEVEARALESMLDQHAITHVMKSYHDSAYDGLFQGPRGWGHVEAPASERARIQSILDAIRQQ